MWNPSIPLHCKDLLIISGSNGWSPVKGGRIQDGCGWDECCCGGGGRRWWCGGGSLEVVECDGVEVVECGSVEVVECGDVEEMPCGGECGVILKSLLRRILDLEDAVESWVLFYIFTITV